VAVKEIDGGVELVVEDRGAGMTDEALEKALLPFYSTKKAGSGLGLSLCREIVEAHGGRLAIERREGGGLAVRCFLPGAVAVG
jgi:signal transduction histidine kinase